MQSSDKHRIGVLIPKGRNRKERPFLLRSKTYQGEPHKILRLRNTSLWLHTLPSGPTGAEVLPPQLCHVGVMPPRLWDAPSQRLSVKVVWPVDTETMATPFETEEVALMIFELPSGSFFLCLEE